MILNDSRVQEIYKIIQFHAQNGTFNMKRVVIFGCAPYTRPIRDALLKNEIMPIGIIDNNSNKQGMICVGLNVYGPEKLLLPIDSDILVIIYSKYANEMIGQLKSMGYSEKENILDISIKVKSEEVYDNSLAAFTNERSKIESGYKIYKRISKKYSEDTLFVMRSTPASGDVYLSCMFINSFLNKNNISKYVFLVVSESCKKIAELFNIKQIEVISKSEASELLQAWMFLGMEKVKIKPLSFIEGRTKRWLRYENYPQITFRDMFQYDIFDLDEDIRVDKPVIDRESNFASALFEEKDLKKEKTFILSPYTGSFPNDVPKVFWEHLALNLIKKGYCVCTNCDGEKEMPIKNTVPIFFPYKEAVNVLEFAGNFIGFRSGLCDIASCARCKMMIIYEQGFNLSLSYDFFSLKKMGLKEDVIEFIYQGNPQKLLDNILSYINEDE